MATEYIVKVESRVIIKLEEGQDINEIMEDMNFVAELGTGHDSIASIEDYGNIEWEVK